MTKWSEVLSDEDRIPPTMQDELTINNEAEAGMSPEAKQLTAEPEQPNWITRLIGGGNIDAAITGAAQGITFGFGDELKSRIRAIGSSTYEDELAAERAHMAQLQEDHPIASIGGNIAGSILPSLLLPEAKAASWLGALGKGAATGAGEAAVQGFGEGEGGVKERLRNAVDSGMTGALFGSAAGTGARAVAKGARAYGGDPTRPTIENLRKVKNDAYKAVAENGDPLDPKLLTGMTNTMLQKMTSDPNFRPRVRDTDKEILGTIQHYKQQFTPKKGKKAGQPYTIGDLDVIRQGLWKDYTRTNNPQYLELVNTVDDTIDAAGGGELMDIARAANKRYKKAELLDHMMKTAERDVGATGSGGNTNNKFRQVASSILKDEKKAKWFTPEEQDALDVIAKGKLPDNAARLVGKLSPSGNGLMAALAFGGSIMYDPTIMGAAVVAHGFKTAADAKTMGRMQNLMDKVTEHTPSAVMSRPSALTQGTARTAATSEPMQMDSAGSALLGPPPPDPHQQFGQSILEQMLQNKLQR